MYASLRPRPFFAVVWRNGSSLACGLFVLVVLLAAALERSLALAVYLLSFWHYYLYWLAFTFGAVPFGVFKRDAIAMKTVSVATLATAYLAAPFDFASLAVIAGGILLNVRAAAALGIDRTYYGHEVAGLPRLKVTAFPYSLTAHPMILGNVAAFGGTLINPAFREHWWPLALLHVVLNIGLLVMERGGPHGGRIVRIGGGLGFAGMVLGAALAETESGNATPAAGAMLGAAAVVCASVLYRRYAPPTPADSAEETARGLT
ncbi:MAG TPA: methyltransferase [Reyranella sp.]|nr:methyltransferase [Reyranella sp.]